MTKPDEEMCGTDDDDVHEAAPLCQHCGEQRATCFGSYEGHEPDGYACDACCGHGNEDGWCNPAVSAPHGKVTG